MKKYDSKLENLTTLIKIMMDQNKNWNSSPENIYLPQAQVHITVFLSNNKDTSMEDGHSTKIGGMGALKHEIRSSKLYELLVKTELKGDTALYLKILYKNINIFPKCSDYTLRRPSYFLPLHQKTLLVSIILFPRSLSPFLFLEFTDLQLPWTLSFVGSNKWHMCKILHGTSGLQGCQHPCSWNIWMEKSIQTSPCTCP